MITFKEYMNFQNFENSNFFCEEFLYQLFDENFTINEIEKSHSSGVQPWIKDYPELSIKDKKLDQKLQNIINKYINPIIKPFTNTLKRVLANQDNKILMSTKSIKSIKSKMIRGTKVEKMKDILRCAVLVKDQSEVNTVLRNIKKYFHIYEIKNKEIGSNEWGYYGTHHYIVEFKNVLIEIQIMPKTTWPYKELAHTVYDKYREKISTNPDIKNSKEYQNDIRYSKSIFRRGAGNKGIHF